MNERIFEVPLNCTSKLAKMLDKYGFEGLIVGRNEDNELIVKVEYDQEEDSQAILEMIEYLEDQKGGERKKTMKKMSKVIVISF